MKFFEALLCATLLGFTSAAFLRRTPDAALHLESAGNLTHVLHNEPAFLQSRGQGMQAMSSGALMMEVLDSRMSVNQVMSHIDSRMNIEEAITRLQGKLPDEVAALVSTGKSAHGRQDPTPVYTTIKPDGNLFMLPKDAWPLNWTANITGTLPADKWRVEFVTGSPPDMSNIALSFEPTPPVLIRNALLGGVWGSPESGAYPADLKPDAKVELLVYRGPTKFEITINGKRAEAFDFAVRTTKPVTAIVIGWLLNTRIDLMGFQVPGKLSEDSLQTARKILNGMIEASYKELDDTTVECASFKDSNRKTFDQVTTDIARLGSETANLAKGISTSLACIADQDVQFKQVKDTLTKEQNQYLKQRAENERLLRLKRNDLAVFDFILDATKCPSDSAGVPKGFLFMQTNASARDSKPNVCKADDGGLELHFDDPKVETRILSMMTDDAKLALRQALGLAMATRVQSEEAEVSLLQISPAEQHLPALSGMKLLMSMDRANQTSKYNPNLPFACHKYESGQFPTNDDQCKKAGIQGDLEFKFVGTSGGCGSCWCCKRPRKCTVTLYEHAGFGGWAAQFPEGVYNYPDFMKTGAKNDQVSSLKVDGPCVAYMFEHYIWQGWTGIYPQGNYDMSAMISRGARNDEASSLIVFPEGYTAAQKACQSVYGQCELGRCGSFTYFYDKNSKTCDCSKPVGQQEFIFENTGYNSVGDDYGGGGESVMGIQIFRRVKALAGCSQQGIWKFYNDLVPTTTPPPPPTPAPVPVTKSTAVAQRYKRCTPVKDEVGICGLLHDTMSLQWGKYKDEVDKLEAEMHKAQDIWSKLSEDLTEQLRLTTGTKTVCQAKFSEATSAKNVLTEESHEKELQKKTLTKEYDTRMTICKERLEELLFTDICAVRTVRNKLMEQSAVTPMEEIVDCEVDDWVASECSVKCDDSCPHMNGPDIDPFKCGGTQKLTRNAIVANNANGFRCPPFTRTTRCGQYKCSVDCKVSEWSGWSKCTKECEGGVQTQTRSIITKPRFGGTACPATVDTRACNTLSCDRDCALSDWAAWDSCSMSCNPGNQPGMQERVKKVLVPIRGEGKCPKETNPARYEKRACNENACRGDEVCVAKQDLIIAIDASGSLRQSGFNTMKAFALKLISKYQSKYLGATAVRIGIVLFGNGAKGGNGGSIVPAINIMPLSEDLTAVSSKVQAMTWQKGFTNMAQAFVLADTMFTEKGRGGSAQSAVMVLSDGRYSFAYETDNAVKKLKEKGTKIYMAPIAAAPGSWEAKIKEWASEPWQTSYQIIPGFGVLDANMDFFVNELVARFCPQSISPSQQEGKDDAKGYMIVRKDGLPNADCAKWYDMGFVNRPQDCMVKVVQEMGLKGFAVSAKMQQGRKCLAEDMKFSKSNYTIWKSAKTNIPCPGGAWENNDLYDTYAIEPMQEDSNGGSMNTNSSGTGR